MKRHDTASKVGVLALVLSVLASSQATAQTTTMDFAGLGLNLYEAIPATYGTHANLSVTNRTRDAFGNGSVSPCGGSTQVSYWSTGYSDLVDNVFVCYNGGVGEFLFTPLNGHRVSLDYLDLGSFAAGPDGIGPLRQYDIRVYDINWNPLFSTTGSVTTTQRITLGTTSNTGLYLQWGTDWNVGLDNLTTTSIPQSAVPEPSTYAMMLLGLLGSVAVSRRRQRRA